MRQQPQVFSALAGSAFSQASSMFGDREFDLVLLAARGSSDNAAIYARYLIEIHLGIPVCLAAPSVITSFQRSVRYPERTLAIGISQSGAAPDVSEVIAALRAAGHATLGITNTKGSRLQKAAEHTLLLDAGPEKAVAATKTYSASLLALHELVRALGGDLGAPSLPDDAWIDQMRAAAEEALGPILRCSPLFCLARGYGFCSALETALKMIECSLLPMKAYSTADFAHGPRALAAYGSAAICYGKIPEGLEETGCSVIRAPETEAGPIEPLWRIIFGQWLALLSARARGLDPDAPPNLSKVTLTL